jgi:hypothetical protein
MKLDPRTDRLRGSDVVVANSDRPLKGASDFEQLAVSLKRKPDTKP